MDDEYFPELAPFPSTHTHTHTHTHMVCVCAGSKSWEFSLSVCTGHLCRQHTTDAPDYVQLFYTGDARKNACQLLVAEMSYY